MTPHARSKIAEIYARDNHLNLASIRIQPKIVIAEAVAPYYLFVESLGPSGLASSTDPVDGLLITMTKRMYEVASGMLALLVLGKLQQAEVLSRTLMESALSLIYIANGNAGERLVRYFEAYVRQREDQNRRWRKELENAPASWKVDHEARIAGKAEALNGYKQFVEYFASEIAVPYPTGKGWPKIIEICTELGKAIDYRTVYTAMCSQSHNDAEDILNFFMVESVQGAPDLSAKLERETGNFSIFLILCGLRYYLECLEHLGQRYGFKPVALQATKSCAEISTLAEEVCAGGFVTNDLDGWIAET